MKRWPAFSLVDIAVVLMVMGVLLTRMPTLMNFYKTYETKQKMDLAMKSLGAHVAKNLPLPQPEEPRTDEEFILRGTLPYKILGIKRKGPAIQYAVDRALTKPGTCLGAGLKGFCNLHLPNNFQTDLPLNNDLIAFELSMGNIKEIVTRNNFVAQYCGAVCKYAADPVFPEVRKSL